MTATMQPTLTFEFGPVSPVTPGVVATSAPVLASSIEQDAPAVIYQTNLVNGKQDSKTPLKLTMRLSDETCKALASGSQPLRDMIHGTIRRFDFQELEAFDEATGRILGVRIPQATFTFDLDALSNTLTVFVHRKELPVSRAFGDAPMVFAFFLKPTREVVPTSSFMVASKESKPAPKRAPKRVRGPPPRRPVLEPPDVSESQINAALAPAAAKRVRVTPPVAAPLVMPVLPNPGYGNQSPEAAVLGMDSPEAAVTGVDELVAFPCDDDDDFFSLLTG